LQITDTITVEAWIKTDTIALYKVVIGKIKNSIAYTLEGDASNKIIFAINARANKAVSDNVLNDNMWHHLVGTYDKSKVRLYVDGVLQTTVTNLTADITDVSDKVGIGAQVGSDDSSGQYFTGLIDDVRIYNYARTPDEIRLDYNAGFAARFGPHSGCDEDPGSCWLLEF
jgi:hypothetical protein